MKISKFTHKTANGIRCFLLRDRFHRTTDNGYVRAFIEDASAKMGVRFEVVDESSLKRIGIL